MVGLDASPGHGNPTRILAAGIMPFFRLHCNRGFDAGSEAGMQMAIPAREKMVVSATPGVFPQIR